jgi:two-component system, cell cycle sensor histidine kinase DivJ
VFCVRRAQGHVGLLKSIRDYIDALVHPSAHDNALTGARHRAFMAPRLLGSFGALAALPVYFVVRGVPSAAEMLIVAWLLAPILSAYLLSRTGNYASAQVLSSVSLIGVIVAVAAMTGGRVSSFAAIWLVVVPLEAALSASRRVVAIVSTMALSASGLLMFFDQMPAIAGSPGQVTLAVTGTVAAMLYATGVAFSMETLVGNSLRMLSVEEDKYQLLASNMTDVITRHGRSGAILFASSAAEPVFGVAPSELSGHGLFDRIHVLDRPAYLTALAEAALGADRSVEFRVRRDQVEGLPQFIWIEMRCRSPNQPIGGSSGKRAREVVAVMRDVTERKVQEQELEQARTEIKRAQTANSRFLTMIGHELRTPLNVIIGFSEMLRDEAPSRIDSEQRREYAGFINDSGNRLLAVVNAILDVSRLDNAELEIRPEPFGLASLIEDCCDLVSLKARDFGVAISVRTARDLPEVVADKRAIKQILINLVSNAVRRADPGGRVIVSAAIDGPMFAIMVDDSGVRIAEDDDACVGDLALQARSASDRRHDGIGFSLSIVKGLAALHGGDTTIRSRVGEGTRVTVRLPLDDEHRRQINRATSLARRAAVAHGSSAARPEAVDAPVRIRA